MRAENAELRREVAKLVELTARLNERVAELLAIAQRKVGARKAKPDAPTPPPPAVGEQAQKAFESRPKAPELPAKKKPAKQKQRPTGRKPLPEHLPAEEHCVCPEACEHCGSTALDQADEFVETKLHVVKEHQRRRVVRRKTVRCRDCGGRTTGTSLPAPYERSKVTGEWLAWFVAMKFSMLVPLDRIRRDLATRGVALAMSVLVGFIERAADLLAPIDGQHWRELLAGSWMQSDATGLKVLIPGLPGSHQGYLEAYRRDDLVVVQYEPEKGAETQAQKLKSFKGTLLVDAEHRYNGCFGSGDIVEAGCNAHGRRKFRDAEAVQPDLAKEGGAFIAAIFEAEARAREQNLTGEALLAWRQDRIGPLRDELRKWMDAVEPTLLPGDALAGVIRYYRNHWDALFRFVSDPGLPPDNSATEREFQTVAKLRLNSLFAGSSEGAHRAAVLLGIVATCRAIGVNPEEYMAWAFERLGTHKARFNLSAAEFTPAAFKRQRPTA